MELYKRKCVGRESACSSFYKFNYETYLNLRWTNNKKVERIRNEQPHEKHNCSEPKWNIDYKWGPRWKHSQLEQKRWMQSPYFVFFTM
jgi:hypothetical protein